MGSNPTLSASFRLFPDSKAGSLGHFSVARCAHRAGSWVRIPPSPPVSDYFRTRKRVAWGLFLLFAALTGRARGFPAAAGTLSASPLPLATRTITNGSSLIRLYLAAKGTGRGGLVQPEIPHDQKAPDAAETLTGGCDLRHGVRCVRMVLEEVVWRRVC